MAFNFSSAIAKFIENRGNEIDSPAKQKRPGRQKIEFDHYNTDLTIFIAILRATSRSIVEDLRETTRSVRNGIKIGDLLDSLPRFSKNPATNRAIVKEAIDSLVERSLVHSSDHGSFQFVQATLGGHYSKIQDFDVNGHLIGERIVTNFFGRGENPLITTYKQFLEKSDSQTKIRESQTAQESETKTETETETSQVSEIVEEEWEAPEMEFDETDDGFEFEEELNPDSPIE